MARTFPESVPIMLSVTSVVFVLFEIPESSTIEIVNVTLTLSPVPSAKADWARLYVHVRLPELESTIDGVTTNALTIAIFSSVVSAEFLVVEGSAFETKLIELILSVVSISKNETVPVPIIFVLSLDNDVIVVPVIFGASFVPVIVINIVWFALSRDALSVAFTVYVKVKVSPTAR